MTDPDTLLSPHFKLAEFVRSRSHPDVYNVPPHTAVDNLRRIADYWLEGLRSWYQSVYCEPNEEHRIIINSGYRSQTLNKLVGGVPGSNHLTGCAVDIRVAGIEDAIRYMRILIDLAVDGHDFDELILERRYNRYWIHLAVKPEQNQHRISFYIK